jgi:hypothetical protein
VLLVFSGLLGFSIISGNKLNSGFLSFNFFDTIEFLLIALLTLYALSVFKTVYGSDANPKTEDLSKDIQPKNGIPLTIVLFYLVVFSAGVSIYNYASQSEEILLFFVASIIFSFSFLYYARSQKWHGAFGNNVLVIKDTFENCNFRIHDTSELIITSPNLSEGFMLTLNNTNIKKVHFLNQVKSLDEVLYFAD